MPLVHYRGNFHELRPNETVLACLERHGHAVLSSCRSGVCQSCLMRAEIGTPPAAARKGLRDAQVKQGYFLACSCVPTEDLHIVDCGDLDRVSATIESVEAVSGRVYRLRLLPARRFDYIAGQFINLLLPCGAVRSYSLASVPGVDPWLELHIALMPGGRASAWLRDEARPGGTIVLAGPQGSCCYSARSAEQPLLLLGTGTGLAPLYGVLRDALHQGHRGPVHLWHGCRVAGGVYYREELRGIAAAHPNVRYRAAVLEAEDAGDLPVGDVLQMATEEIGSFKDWRVFLCGHPDFVKQAQRTIFLAGASLAEISADAFVPAAVPAENAAGK